MQEVLFSIVAGVAIFFVGVVLSQKIKDAFSGVPASLRADLTALETAIKVRVVGAQKAVVTDVKVAVMPPIPRPAAVVVPTGTAPMVPTGLTGMSGPLV
jgi:hypothetical protein